MCILKPDFSQIIQAIMDIREGKDVAWEEVISQIENEMQEAYEETMDKINEVKDNVLDLVANENITDCDEELAETIEELKLWS